MKKVEQLKQRLADDYASIARAYPQVASRTTEEYNDCFVTALAIATGVDYNVAHRFCRAFGRQRGKGVTLKRACCVLMRDNGIREILISAWVNAKYNGSSGKVYRSIEFGGSTYFVTLCKLQRKRTVANFALDNPDGMYMCFIHNHAFVVDNGAVINQTKQSQLVQEYWKFERVI